MKNRLIFNHPYFRFSPVILSLLFLPILEVRGESNPHNELLLRYQDTQIIVSSAAQVLLKLKTSNTLLDYCAIKFKHLNHSANTASQDWQNKHAEIITKANNINRYVAKTIETHDSSFAAEKFNLQIDLQIYDGAQKLKTELTSKNRKRQHYLCNRLILSTAMGDGDLAKVIPEHFQRVNEFKFKK